MDKNKIIEDIMLKTEHLRKKTETFTAAKTVVYIIIGIIVVVGALFFLHQLGMDEVTSLIVSCLLGIVAAGITIIISIEMEKKWETKADWQAKQVTISHLLPIYLKAFERMLASYNAKDDLDKLQMLKIYLKKAMDDEDEDVTWFDEDGELVTNWCFDMEHLKMNVRGEYII